MAKYNRFSLLASLVFCASAPLFGGDRIVTNIWFDAGIQGYSEGSVPAAVTAGVWQQSSADQSVVVSENSVGRILSDTGDEVLYFRPAVASGTVCVPTNCFADVAVVFTAAESLSELPEINGEEQGAIAVLWDNDVLKYVTCTNGTWICLSGATPNTNATVTVRFEADYTSPSAPKVSYLVDVGGTFVRLYDGNGNSWFPRSSVNLVNVLSLSKIGFSGNGYVDGIFGNWILALAGVKVENGTLNITLSDAWVQERFNGVMPTGAQLDAIDENGLKVWQNYVLGLAAAAQLKADAPQNSASDTISLASTATPATDTGFSVSYSVDEVSAVGAAINSGAVTVSPVINLASVNSNGYFRLNAFLKADGTDGDGVKVTAANTIGVMKVVPVSNTAIVAVPWNSLVTEGDILISNLVKTAGLGTGTKLHVYNHESNGYDTWELDSSKNWNAVSRISASTLAATGVNTPSEAKSAVIARGKAFWLEQSSTAAVYLYGNHDTTAVTTVLDKGAPSAEVWNLIASPGADDFDISSINGNNADKIVVPTASAPKTYTRVNGRWGYSKVVVENGRAKVVRDESDTVVPAGSGFWYLSGSSESPSIIW